ncbi:MAG: hypothetical protein BJ554DRAFT_6392 [Olpidium bornovanus]|uniref:Polynucleotide 5'-hydroxyl-kinase GRC3 n=1 Tax=Olpidium bornovanus TaxID=278681 RepID=A0A8H8DK93_9FUNG|nr:MAG: hypothetical protein BJ554DRAFT_6392 [Olpidium bornovanus]
MVTSPLLGPPYTHLAHAEHAHYIGSPSPRDDPGYYVECLCALVNNYRLLQAEFDGSLPLVVNTQGWVKGSI